MKKLFKILFSLLILKKSQSFKFEIVEDKGTDIETLQQWLHEMVQNETLPDGCRNEFQDQIENEELVVRSSKCTEKGAIDR